MRSRGAGCRCPLLGSSSLSLAFLLDRHMVANCAADYRTGNGVVACDVATDDADCRATQATRGIGRR